jgi:hypothetical protein
VVGKPRRHVFKGRSLAAEGLSWYPNPSFCYAGRNLGTGCQGFGVILANCLPCVIFIVRSLLVHTSTCSVCSLIPARIAFHFP